LEEKVVLMIDTVAITIDPALAIHTQESIQRSDPRIQKSTHTVYRVICRIIVAIQVGIYRIVAGIQHGIQKDSLMVVVMDLVMNLLTASIAVRMHTVPLATKVAEMAPDDALDHLADPLVAGMDHLDDDIAQAGALVQADSDATDDPDNGPVNLDATPVNLGNNPGNLDGNPGKNAGIIHGKAEP
jgi:hypothetical protein